MPYVHKIFKANVPGRPPCLPVVYGWLAGYWRLEGHSSSPLEERSAHMRLRWYGTSSPRKQVSHFCDGVACPSGVTSRFADGGFLERASGSSCFLGLHARFTVLLIPPSFAPLKMRIGKDLCSLGTGTTSRLPPLCFCLEACRWMTGFSLEQPESTGSGVFQGVIFLASNVLLCFS